VQRRQGPGPRNHWSDAANVALVLLILGGSMLLFGHLGGPAGSVAALLAWVVWMAGILHVPHP
jgi:hypothetical protein